MLRRARRALDECRIDGLATNLPLLQALARRPEMASQAVHTRWLEEALPELVADAQALAEGARRIALLGPIPTHRDGRTVALLDGSWRLLGELGLHDALADRAAPLAVMRLVDDTGSLFRQPPVEFRASEVGLPAFCWNV